MITTNRIDAKNIDYYRDKYFFANPDCPGVWMGSGCKFLGLAGVVTQLPHERLLEGFSPEGAPLIRNAGQTEGWFGVDIVGNADKTLSVVLAASLLKERRSEVAALMVDAMRPAIALLEDRGAIVRFGKGGIEREKAQTICGAYPQFENREGEIHAHIHCAFYRPAFTADGRTAALDQQSIFQPKLKMALGAVMRAEAAFLSEQRFGMLTERKGFGFRVVGVPERVVEATSQRRQAIEAHLSEHGLSSARAAAYATLATRNAKVHTPLPELMAQWGAQLRDLGFGPDVAARCLNHPPVYAETTEARQQTALDLAIKRVTEHQSYFNDLDLIRYVAEEAQGRGLSAQMVLQTVDRALEQSPEIVRVGMAEERPVFTTREIDALENQLFVCAEAAQCDHSHIVRSQTVDVVLARNPHLSDEHRHATRYLTERPGAVQLLGGGPGTGKTTLLRSCVECWTADGFLVYGAAPTGKAAIGLTTEAGIPSETIAMTLIRLREDSARQRQGQPARLAINEKTIFVVDEAATVGTRQLAELQRELRARGAKIILSGDPRQTQSIEFGGGMSGLIKRLGQAELTDIHRQREPWARQAVKSFGEGDAATALKEYAKQGCVTVSANRTDALLAMIQDWSKEGVFAPKDNLMITTTRAEARRANEMAHAARREAGALQSQSIDLNGIDYYKNDRVMFEKNNRPLGVRNGQVGTIVDLRPSERLMVVQIDDGPRVLIPLDAYSHVSRGYALTTHKSQGITVPRAFCLVSETPDRELALVQASRHRELCKFYVDKFTAGEELAELAKAMSRSHQQVMAHDIARRDPSYVVLQPEFQR